MNTHLQPEFPLAHFHLQEQYATYAMKIMQIPLSQALLEYTMFYRRIGCGDWKFSKTNSVWQILENRILNGERPGDIAFDLHVNSLRHQPGETGLRFGCFRYDYEQIERTVVLHFKNIKQVKGPLSPAMRPDRLQELKEMFVHISSNYPEAMFVRGCSWVYDHPGYRALFPQSYTANMPTTQEPLLKVNSIWGQFLQSSGTLHHQRTQEFLEKLSQARTQQDLFSAFPVPIYVPKALIKDFYEEYDISINN